jgi:hypothetical protein
MYTEETVKPHKYVHYEETVNPCGNTGIYTEETNNCYPWNMFTRKKRRSLQKYVNDQPSIINATAR